MQEPVLEYSNNHPSHKTGAPQSCPIHRSQTQPDGLDFDDELVLPRHRRTYCHYSTEENGAPLLTIYYGEKEISFDEPELFAFGEQLTRQARFRAGAATTWGAGYPWPRIRELLEQLISEGVLQRAEDAIVDALPRGGPRPSPMPPAPGTKPLSWRDCSSVMQELTGHTLDLAYLECVVPIHRVAHMAVDGEGRQVGEANVFPWRTRLPVPTEWRSCPHAGSRYEAEPPMNVTALKSIRNAWPQIMLALGKAREAYLQRFELTGDRWTVGQLHRLASLVLALPAYLLMRADNPLQNGELHPVLSSMFRVTDGVQMITSLMLYTPEDEPTRFPDASVTSEDLYAYAERNEVFFSSYGVCAGPPAMIKEFLAVLVDGKPAAAADTVSLEPAVVAALNEIDKAFDYGLLALQTHALVFTLWPLMGRAYERCLALLRDAPDSHLPGRRTFAERLDASMDYLRQINGLEVDEWWVRRERVYADLYTQCEAGLGPKRSGIAFAEWLESTASADRREAADNLKSALSRKLCAHDDGDLALRLTDVLMTYFRCEQAIVRAADAIQRRVGQVLGRAPAEAPLKASDLHLFYHLQAGSRRQPYLGEDLLEVLGINVTVTPESITVAATTAG